MDILLINLNNFIDEHGQESKFRVKQVGSPPLGLLYVAQLLLENSYNVKVYDQNVTVAENFEVLKLIKKLNPKIVGFSVLLDNLWTVKDIQEKLKKWNPNIITVAGNYFATFFPEKLMREIDFDFCIRGEGEFTFLSLVEHLDKKRVNFHEIKGLTFRENNVIKSTPLPEKLTNLDKLPIPNRKLIEFNPGLAGKSTSILSSRGCPFQCRFCTFSIVMGRKWRPRSVKNVVEEIKLLKDQKYKDIAFIDDNFTLNKKRIFRLCAEIKRNQLDNLRFVGDCRVDNATFDILRALVTAHFIQIVFGIESGTQRILDYYNKRITLAQIKQAVKNADKTRLEFIYGSFLLGAPSETLSEVRDTIKFANKLNITIPIFQILYANPISPIYRELVEKGQYLPQEDDWKKVFKIPDISPTSLPIKVLMRLIEEEVNQILGKRRIIHHLFKALKYKYYIDTTIASIIKRELI